MGLSTPSAIYQARFAKYLESRSLKPANGGKIWAFVGDGESDEPEVLGTINIASRENLDNLVLVIVITSYSIHYTKLYETRPSPAAHQ